MFQREEPGDASGAAASLYEEALAEARGYRVPLLKREEEGYAMRSVGRMRKTMTKRRKMLFREA